MGWYKATVPGTVLTTLVENKVYPEPLYGENMRAIPESLNKTSYWYRTEMEVPAAYRGRHTWLHFGGVNYAAEIWVNGQQVGAMRGAFVRGDFDVTEFVRPGGKAMTVAVLVAPQPHPGMPHEHTVANGEGEERRRDGARWADVSFDDWLGLAAGGQGRDTGIWLPVTLSSTGPVVVKDPFVTSEAGRLR